MQPRDRGREADRESGTWLLSMALAATVIGILEAFLPRPLPFVKPGLANAVTVVVVLQRGAGAAIRVNLLRALTVALATGTLATPSFVMSLAGAMSSALAMGAARRCVPGLLSVIGLSIVGSSISMAAQLAFACALIPGLPAASLVPLLAAWAAVSGALTGAAAALATRLGLPGARKGGLVVNNAAG